MGIVDEIKCSHCGAPISFQPGELLATCKYCGYTVVIETGRTFTFEHSLLLNAFDQVQVETRVRSWMREGFMKPSDLARKAKLTGRELIYLPFWVVSVEARSSYRGIFERISPAVVKEGVIEKDYDWLVLARKATEFPTREYQVPLEGKIPFDFRRIEALAKVLNSEITKDEAEEQAKAEIEGNHKFLAQQDVDKIIEMKTEIKIEETVYLHAPIWFIKYEYKGKDYQLMIDGATGVAVKGDIPSTGFGIL
jgi:DNA-directed RNA polymerase subunit RPC12/RpoP